MEKRILLLFVLVLHASTILKGQDVGAKTLISQARTTAATIGLCSITIQYHSPSVNNRKIFGGIVPYHFEVDGVEYPWRAGSNQRTTIEFSHDVLIEGKPLAAGNYGFLVLVEKEVWTLIFSSGKSWGAFNYNKSNDVLRVSVPVKKVLFQEWLSYEYVYPTSDEVGVQLRWEEAAVTFRVKTDALQNSIDDLNSKENKTSTDYQDLAIRILEQNPDRKEEALSYLEKSFSLLPSIENEYYRQAAEFNYKILKSEILLSAGKKSEGIELKKEALKTASGFNVYYYALRTYTLLGKKEEAYSILQQQIKVQPDNYQNYFALGEYYLKEGNQQEATNHFKIAYDMTVAQKSRWENYARYLYLQNKLALESNVEAK